MSAAPVPAAVRERPLPFSGDSVRAILTGTKTQTRRVVVPQPAAGVRYRPGGGAVEDGHGRPIVPRYGVPPELLWVRETWATAPNFDHLQPRDLLRGSIILRRADNCATGGRWRSGRFMPRWASRITLELTDVRVQRVQAISDDDLIREGMGCPAGADVSLALFRDAWDTLNARRGYPWIFDPWVWVLTFRRLP